MKLSRIALLIAVVSIASGTSVMAQRPGKKPLRSLPPKFQPNEFSGVFYSDAIAQLQGDLPSDRTAGVANNATNNGNGGTPSMDGGNEMGAVAGNQVWKTLISDSTIEDLVKESKSRLDGVVTTPAKFAGGGFADARREFTLLATLMAINSQYPDEIKWKASASYSRSIFARMASNCKAGSQQVFNEAKSRLQDLSTLLKSTKLSGNADEVSWADTADRGPTMQLLEWALRENLAPNVSSESKFKSNQEEILKYAELVAAYGQVMQQEGMTDADDVTYNQLATAMVQAAKDAAKAAKTGDADLARTSVSRIDQSCNKCHESYR